MIISSNGRTVDQVFGGSFYKIPRFQRAYSWDKANVEDFWNDILEGGSGYFIGSMVIYPEGDAYGVVDGQQRLTTITMVLAAIRNALLDIQARTEAAGIQTMIERVDTKGQRRFALQTETSYPYLQKRIQAQPGTTKEAVATGAEESNLESAFDLILSNVKTIGDAVDNDASIPASRKSAEKLKRLSGLRDSVLALTLVLIEVDDPDDATVIFQTLNSRGKDLEVADLVKSHLLSIIRAQNVQLDEARDDWNGILDSFDESAADISVNRFLLHCWHSREEYVSEKQLFRRIKSKVKASRARDFLDELVSDADLYRVALEPFYGKWTKPQLGVRDSLRALNLFRLRQPLPMVLSLLREYYTKRLPLRWLNYGLTVIEDYHFISTAVTNQPSSGGVSRMYAAAARNLLNAKNTTDKSKAIVELRDKLVDRLPSYAEFEASFLELRSSKQFTQQAPLVRYILSRLHSQAVPAGTAVPLDYDKLTVEHLASQSTKRLPANDVARIGNLLLVTQELNDDLADLSFARKQAILKGVDGVDTLILSATQWTAIEIESRSKDMAKRAYDDVWTL